MNGQCWTRRVWAVWLVIVVGLAVYAYLYPYNHTVYDIYSGASRRWLAGEDAYVRTREYYRYSPAFAIALSPLAVLPDAWGGALWRFVNCGVFAWGLAAWVRRLHVTHAEPAARNTAPPTARNTAPPAARNASQAAAEARPAPQARRTGPWTGVMPHPTAAVFLLVLPMSLHSMYNSQANLMMLGSILLGMAAAAEARWNRAAAWIAWATLIKIYPLALALLLAALYPRRFMPRYVAALAIGLLLPFATAVPEVVANQYGSWLSHMLDSSQIMRERVRSIDWLFAVCRQPLGTHATLALEAAGGLGALAMCLVARRRATDPRETSSNVFQWFALWVVLFGPATEACTYVVAAPVVAWELVDAFRRRASLASKLVLIASLLLMGPVVTDLFGPTVRSWATNYGSQPLGGLLLAGYLLTRVAGSRGQTASPQGGRSKLHAAIG